MTSKRKRIGLPLSYSVLLHGVILALFIFTISETPKSFDAEPEPEIVAATVLDENKVNAEVERLKQKEIEKQRAEERRQQQAVKARQQEAERLAELKEQRLLEQQRAEEQAEKRKQEREAEAEKIALLQKQKAEERERLEQIKKQKDLAKKKRIEEEKRLAKLEKQRKLELKKQQEKKAREEAERKVVEQRLAAERRRQAEQERARAAAANRANKEIANAKVLIQQKVNRNWLRPSAIVKGLSCRIQVKLIPGGDVVDARVIRSSGNPAFDRSAEIAVRKASPLPLPTDPKLFSMFRNFDFEFRPDA